MNPNEIRPSEEIYFWEVLLVGLSALCSLGSVILGGAGVKVYFETGVLPDDPWGTLFIVISLLAVVLYLGWIIIKNHLNKKSEVEK